MEYQYPPDFPQPSRARIKAAKIDVGRSLNVIKELWTGADLEKNVKQSILQVVAVFAEESIKLGRSGAWSADAVDTQVREFLRHLTIEWQYDRFGNRIGNMVCPQSGALEPQTRHEFESSFTWLEYEKSLLEVAMIQAADDKKVEPANERAAVTPPAETQSDATDDVILFQLRRRQERLAATVSNEAKKKFAIEQELKRLRSAAKKAKKPMRRIAPKNPKALRDSYFSSFAEKIIVLDVCWAAKQRYREWTRWMAENSSMVPSQTWHSGRCSPAGRDQKRIDLSHVQRDGNNFPLFFPYFPPTF